jgi:hypothetical protein
MLRRSLALLALFIAFPSAVLAADATGSAGAVAELEVNSSSADIYLQYNGRVVIAGGKASVEYRWGGTSCGTRVLSESMVAMLQRVQDSGAAIQPRFQIGQGDVKCLVGFNIL